MVTEARPQKRLDYQPLGGNKTLFTCTDREILIEGPAGSGKTRACLELVHALATLYPGMKGLIVRKTLTSLTASALRTYEEKVLDPAEGVRFFGGNKSEPAAYRYPDFRDAGGEIQTGSRIVVGGMDNPEKILSSEYDFIYVNEAVDLTQEDWQTLTTRLGRDKVTTKIPNPRILGDCNPSFARHWLNQRCDAGQTTRIKTFLHDNPALDPAYIEGVLEKLTGTMRERYYLGEWVGMQNMVYPQFDRSLHVRDVPDGTIFTDGAIGVDYGRVHKAASVVISVDQFGRRWVREAWGEPDEEHGEQTARAVGFQWQKYKIRRARTDPNQDVLVGSLQKSLGSAHINLGKGQGGARIQRIRLTSRLLNNFPGGHVFSFADESALRLPQGPWETDDSPGLLFVRGAPGIDELCDQLESYHFIERNTETRTDLVVVRDDEDLVAGMEYAIEELEQPFTRFPAKFTMEERKRYRRGEKRSGPMGRIKMTKV